MLGRVDSAFYPPIVLLLIHAVLQTMQAAYYPQEQGRMQISNSLPRFAFIYNATSCETPSHSQVGVDALSLRGSCTMYKMGTVGVPPQI